MPTIYLKRFRENHFYFYWEQISPKLCFHVTECSMRLGSFPLPTSPSWPRKSFSNYRFWTSRRNQLPSLASVLRYRPDLTKIMPFVTRLKRLLSDRYEYTRNTKHEQINVEKESRHSKRTVIYCIQIAQFIMWRPLWV